MALGWLTLLKSVPWAGVISSAPVVADGARQLWKAVSKKPAAPEPISHPPVRPDAGDVTSLEALESRIARLESGLDAMHAQMLKSSELIKALADQNALMIERVEANRVRTLWLTGLATLALIVGVAALIFVMLG
ncbi:MAG: hypothetical protein IV085_07400 [Thiobacillus sp.]|nr:hypothetical protein [Thiobacillus sp.]